MALLETPFSRSQLTAKPLNLQLLSTAAANPDDASLPPAVPQPDSPPAVSPSWRAHIDWAVALGGNEVFLDGWLVDPEGMVAKAFVRMGRRVSEDLLVVAARYPRIDVVAKVPGAAASTTPHGLAARVQVLGPKPPPGVDALDPPSQVDLVLVTREGAIQTLRLPLSTPQALPSRDQILLGLAPHSAQLLAPRSGAPRGLLRALLRALRAPVRLLLRPFSKLKPVLRSTDLVPAQHLVAQDRAQGEWLAVGPDPVFRCRRPLPPGFYMLELELGLSRTHARAQLYFDFGEGESESRSALLTVRDSRRTKRLVWLHAPARIRFDPSNFPGKVAVRHFRLTRVSQSFAASRMRRKLRAAGVVQDPSTLALPELWERYAGLFAAEGHTGPSYEDWLREVEALSLPDAAEQRATVETWPRQPRISILTPTYNTPLAFLRACAESVLGQTYPHWEWCLADDASTEPEVRAYLEELASTEPRVRVVFRPVNGHISEASNTALELATGEFVALLDHDDTLAHGALFHVVEALQGAPDAALVYSDEDKLDEQGVRCDPFFKPDWSPELLLGQNYVCHLGVYRRDLVTALGGFRAGYEGSQDYDLLLRCSQQLPGRGAILHVPRMLYHWRKSAASTAKDGTQKSYATEAAVRALGEHMAARADTSERISVVGPGLYRHHWPLPASPPLVSIIIPTRNGHALLHHCITSLVERTTYPAYELIIVDNQSTCPATLAYLAELAADPSLRVQILRYHAPFNFSAINNLAATAAHGEILLLLNNDIEIFAGGWLTEMVSHCLRPHIGCVGAKLYYPNDTIQHAGVVLGIGGVAGHSHKYFERCADGYFGRLRIAHEVSAVTGAALAVRKDIYFEVGGMDEERLTVAFNDVDLCLKVATAGYRNLITPFAELRHHESRTRGLDDTPEKRERFSGECATMRKRWGSLLDRDPYYNPNLTLTHEDYSLAALPLTKAAVPEE